MNMFKTLYFNVLDAFSLKKLTVTQVGGYQAAPMSLLSAIKTIFLFRKVFLGESYGVLRSIFLLLIGRHFSICLMDSGRVVAFELFRLGSEDVVNGTIHESFIGVSPEYQGKGLSTAIRDISKHLYTENGYRGISTRIEMTNVKSFKSAERIGYKVVHSDINRKGNMEAYLILELVSR